MAGLGNAMQAPPSQAGPMSGDEQDEGGQPATPEEQQLYETFVGEAMRVIYPEGEDAQVSPQVLDDLRGNMDPKALSIFKDAQPPLAGSPQDMVSAEAVMLTILIDEKIGMSAAKMQAAQAPQPQAAPMPAAPGSPALPASPPMEDDTGGEEPPGKEDDGAREYGEGPDYDAVLMHAGQAIFEELVEIAEAAKIHEFSEQEMEGAWYRAMDLYTAAAETIGKTGYDKEALKAEFANVVAADKAGKLGEILPGLPGGKSMQKQEA